VAQSTHTPYSASFDNANWLGPPSRKNQHKGSPCNTFFWQNACFSDQDAERTGIKARSALVLRALEQMTGLKLGVIRQRDQRNLDLAPHRRFTLPAADSTALPISLPFSFTAMIIRRDPMLAAAFTLRAIGSVR
jgi:hypothetical protein